MAFDDTLDNSTRPPSDRDSHDLAAASIKGALSNIPIVGGSVGEVFGLVIAPSQGETPRQLAGISSYSCA
jgi:hypothetical protein